MTRTMKDSGIDWIGQIPEDWDISKVKYCFTRKNSKAKQEDPVVLSLARSGVKVRDISTNEGQLAESYYDYNPVQVGDLLLNPMDLYSGANCSYSNVEGVISPAYINLRNKKDVSNSKFYDYYFKVQYWMMVLFSFGKGVSFDNRWTLGQETLMNFPLAYPSLPEQQKIADFLDEKCSHIDSVLEKTRASIEEYKQLKQSVITQAVTKGIRPNHPMKDSGIEWIGEIPEDWEICKLKYLTSLVTDGSHIAPDTSELKRKFVSVADMNEYGDIDFDSCLKITEEQYQYLKRTGCKPKCNDILISKDGTIGKTTIVKTQESFVVASSLVIIRPKNNLNSEYLRYILMSENTQRQLNLLVAGTALKRVSVNKNANLLIVNTLNMNEQQEIVTYLDDRCSEIDKLIAKKEQLIEELEIYKKSLIYEYVTGKKEVC